MKVGVTLFVQNYSDWDRFEAAERGESVASKPAESDQKRFMDDLKLALAAEPLGYDSVWTVEHHFTPYTMVTNPMQYLSYIAGRTERVDLGTMVVVLPWHHPVRVAEDIAMLDSFLGPNRNLQVGFGRGLGKREFEGFNVDMNKTRDLFNENLQIVAAALSNDRFSYDGQFYKIEDLAIRPTPPRKRGVEDFYGAWGSPGSVPAIAGAGLKPLIIPQRRWEDYTGEIEEFAKCRAEAGFKRPAAAKIAVWIYCAKTDEEARAGALQYLTEYGESGLRHYQILGDHFAKTKGYESYAEGSKAMQQLEDPFKVQGEMMIDNNVYGSPKTCIEKMQRIAKAFDPSEVMLIFSYGQMSHEDAMRSMTLFAKECLPEIRSWKTAQTTLN
jgi:alkanesulfonate monooxygenase SsuD/methylene tetrahydromethanopterin reductase-like flavin-dependent oxidoreductase (luciferase family)